MGLFGKKTKEPVRESEKVPAKEQPTEAMFSSRMTTIFSKLYDLVLSVNLKLDVFQLELGKHLFLGIPIPQRGYYSTFARTLCNLVPEETRDSFLVQLSAESIRAAVRSGEPTLTVKHEIRYPVLKEEPEEGEESIMTETGSIVFESGWFEFRFDFIPTEDVENPRFLLFIRSCNPDKPSEVFSEEESQNHKWDDVRINKLTGGTNTLLFEYHISDDTMYVHLKEKGLEKSRTIKRYLADFDHRADWTVSHKDISIIRKAMDDAIRGKAVQETILYRENGNLKGDFRVHRFNCVLEDTPERSEWIIGSLTDINDLAEEEQMSEEVESELNEVFYAMHSGIYRIDVENDTIATLEYEDHQYVEKASAKLSSFIAYQIKTESVHPDFAEIYERFRQKGYLQRKTLAGNYEFDVQLKRPGELEYRWYTETICSIDSGRYFLRLLRDVSDLRTAQQSMFALEEQSRLSEYNRQMLDTMASLVEFRNIESGAHIDHVRQVTRILLEDVMVRSPLYDLTREQINLYVEASTVHDIGKIVVPDHILNKPGRLTSEEYAIMKTHTTSGAKIVDKINMAGQKELLEYCREVALHHHERFDGSGYPEGLSGDAIKIGTQVIGMADVYDALVSERCYKEALEYTETAKELLNGEFGSFNPRILESFANCLDKILAIYMTEEEN